MCDDDFDLTGTHFASSDVIAVFSGSGDLDTFVTAQLLPIVHWGKEHVAFSLPYSNGGYIVKIIASEDSTTIFENGNLGRYLFDAGQYVSYFNGNDPQIIIADKPVMVVLFVRSTSSPLMPQKGFIMLVLPSIGLYESIGSSVDTHEDNYSSDDDAYLVIITRRQWQGHIVVDKDGVHSSLWEYVIGSDALTLLWYRITSGHHTVNITGSATYFCGQVDIYENEVNGMVITLPFSGSVSSAGR